MGVELYEALRKEFPDVECRVYAPVGGHRDLLAYLVRRLLENGANTSIVSVSANLDIPIASLLKRPSAFIDSLEQARHPKICCCAISMNLDRRNSPGVEFGDRKALEALTAEIAAANAAGSRLIIDGEPMAAAAKGFAPGRRRR